MQKTRNLILNMFLSYREKRRLRRSFDEPFFAGRGRGEFEYYENGRSVQMDTELMRGPIRMRIYRHKLKWSDNGEVLTATKQADVLAEFCNYFDQKNIKWEFYDPK